MPDQPRLADDFEELLDQPGVYIRTVTPAIAEQMLKHNTDNRRPKTRAISTYQRAMKNKKWRLTNQGIGFDTNKKLSDGQNRLLACLIADTEFVTLIATGLEPESREVVDVGVRRLFADVLRMHEYLNVMQLSGGAGLRFRYEKLVAAKRPYHQFNLEPMRGNHEELLEFVREHPSLDARASQFSAVTKTFPSLPASSVVAFESMASEVDPIALDEFRTSLITGANLDANDARLVLRNFLSRAEPTRKGGPTAMYFLGLLVKAWNDWRNGLTREMLTIRDNEAMPALDAKPTWSAQQRHARRTATAQG